MSQEQVTGVNICKQCSSAAVRATPFGLLFLVLTDSLLQLKLPTFPVVSALVPPTPTIHPEHNGNHSCLPKAYNIFSLQKSIMSKEPNSYFYKLALLFLRIHNV